MSVRLATDECFKKKGETLDYNMYYRKLYNSYYYIVNYVWARVNYYGDKL